MSTLSTHTDRPLAGRRVVVTRPRHQADGLARGLRTLGAEPLFAPSIQVRPPLNADAIRRAAPSLAAAAWLVFTSANGVRFAWPLLAEAWPCGLPSALRIAAIGPSTARAVRERGAPVDYVPEASTAESLAASLPVAPGERVVLLQADIAHGALRDGLTERGAEVRDVAAYQTVPEADPGVVRDVLARHPNAITFTSTSTVRGFLAAVDDVVQLGDARLVAIGPVTAKQMERLGLPAHAIAREPSTDGLLDALVHLFAAHPAR